MFAVKKHLDLVYSVRGDLELLLDLYLPVGEGKFPLLVFFHGGGLEGGSKDDLVELAQVFAQRGVAVALPNYSLYPAANYPSFIEDGAAAIKWVLAEGSGYLQASHLFVGGHSAGAYLAMMLCLADDYLAKAKVAQVAIDGYLCFSGQPTTHFNVLRERGLDPNKVVIDEAAPIYHAKKNGPPMLLACADQDISNRLEQTYLLVSTLGNYGYEQVEFCFLEGYDHGNYFEINNGLSKLHQVSLGFIERNRN